MELIYTLSPRRRLQRELQRREAALRAAEHAPESVEPKSQSPVAQREQVVSQAAEPRPESLVAQYASTKRGPWECDLCGRSFHAYARFLNHSCHER